VATHEASHELTDIHVNDVIGPRLTALATKAPIFAIIGGVLCAAGLLLTWGTNSFFQSYLYAFMFWFGVTLGSTAWLMGHHVTGGGWGFILRRPLEAATRLWPLVLAMWVPIAIAMLLSMLDGHHGLYEWADAGIRNGDKILTSKSGYLNPLGWLIRGVLYFCIWFGLAFYLNKWSREEDLSSNPMVRHKLSLMSAAGLLVYALTVTFASIDWVMSIEPHWFSSLWGLIFVVGQGHATLCLMIVLLRYLAWDSPLLKKVETRYFRDLGNLMLTFTLLWAYTNYSQFMIQYSGNIPEEATWQLHRTTFGWQYFGFTNIILHFALPFFFLLASLTKVNIRNLAKLATFLIFARLVDLFFYVVPTFRKSPLDSFPFAILTDIGAPLLLGGLWLMAWANQMRRVNAPIVPQFDERLNGFWPLEGAHDAQNKGEHGHGGGHAQVHGGDHITVSHSQGVTTNNG
jgi:hypothetical protein